MSASDRPHRRQGCLGRRHFLGMGAALPALAAGASVISVSAQEPKAAAGKADPGTKWGVPGPYPGRVVEIRNQQMIKNDVKNREAIHQATVRGMMELTARPTRSKRGKAFSSPAMSSA